MFGRFCAVLTGVVLAMAVGSGPALAEQVTLFGVMIESQPIQYWVLDDQSGPAQNFVEGQAPMAPYGFGPAVTWHTASHPVGGYLPFSVRLNPTGPRAGQYLRSGLVPGELYKPGSVVIWFRLPKALPTWTQVLAVDNGAWSGTAAGLMITPTGRLASEDVTGFTDFVSKRTLDDARWHCAIWEDTYRPGPYGSGSTLYLDGIQLTSSLVALWVPRLGVDNARLLLGDGGVHEKKGMGRFTGNLSNVAIYDHPLSQGEINDIWTVGSTGSFGGGPV